MDIIIKDISKSFNNIKVLDKFTAKIKAHSITCIMGQSGCGKTTLLNILMGILTPEEGIITGVPLKKSVVFQEDRLIESFTAVSNVRLVCPKEVTTITIEKHLTEIGLLDSMHIPVSELSGGMKRRVAIVRAILAKSEIIFFDEPFKGLDKDTTHSVIKYIKANTIGKTIILVTHHKDEVEEMNGELLLMDFNI